MGMETRVLGRTGLDVGVIGLGTEHLTFNHENMNAVLDMAVPAGVNYITLVFNDPLNAHADYWEAIGPAIHIRRHHESRVCRVLQWLTLVGAVQSRAVCPPHGQGIRLH